MRMATDQFKISEFREALDFEPAAWQRSTHPLIAHRFTSIKRKISEARKSNGSASDDVSARRLIYWKTRLQWGRFVDSESRIFLKAALEQKKATSRELHNAVCSLGGMTSRSGKMYSIHFPKWFDRTNMIAIICLFFLQLYCLVFSAIEYLTVCRACAITGAFSVFILALVMTDVLLTIGPRRRRAAILLRGVGIAGFHERQDKRLSDLKRFFYLRAKLDEELKNHLVTQI